MNTSIKITQITNSKAKYRAKEIVRNIPNLDFDADIVIVKNEQIEAKFLNKNQKEKRVQLQKNLYIYKKRLGKAIEDGKEKSIATNTKKIEEIEKKLEEANVPKGRKKNFLEISLQLTNSNIDPKKFNNYEMFYEFIKTNRFTKDLDLKVAAYHKDQHSPHMQALFDTTNIDNFADYLRSKVDYKINDTREIYSIIQNDFHDFVAQYYELDKMKKGQDYMPINKYKIFTLKIEKIRKYVENAKKVFQNIFEIRDHFKFVEESDKMYEAFLSNKQEKNDFRAVSDDLNDINETYIYKQRLNLHERS